MNYHDCSICLHPNRLDMDRELVQGKSIASVARKFGVKYNSVNNHFHNHISRQLSQVYEKRELEASMDLLGRIDQILSRAEDIFKRNYKAKKDGLALKALAEQRSTIDLLAKISYNLHQAKLAELEIQRHTSGDVEAERESALGLENFNTLNPTEQGVFRMLLVKMTTKDTDMVVIPEQEGIKLTDPAKYIEVEPIVEEEQEKVVENDSEDEPDNPLRVKPVPPTQIPSSKRNNQPFSGLHRRS